MMQQIAAEVLGLSVREDSMAGADSFAALVARQSRFAFRIAYSILRNIQDSEDAVQEAFFRLYRSRAWERVLDEKAFIARVTWRVAVKRIGTRTLLPTEGDPPSTAATPEQAAIAADRSRIIHRLIDALPEDLRQPLALSTVEELTSAQIASILDIPEGTVRTRLMRARQILKQKASVLLGGLNE